MVIKKEPVEIKCSGCNTNFRLWIPSELLTEWGSEEFNCIKCQRRFVVKKTKTAIEVKEAEEEPLEIEIKDVIPEKELHKVIFVDDDKLATAIAENTCSDMKMNFLTARSGEEALKKIANDRFDLIVTDLHLKDSDNTQAQLDGEDFLRKVVENGKNIPAIIITGKDLIDDLALDPKWFDLHVRGFIQKGNPFWAEELKNKIKELLDVD